MRARFARALAALAGSAAPTAEGRRAGLASLATRGGALLASLATRAGGALFALLHSVLYTAKFMPMMVVRKCTVLGRIGKKGNRQWAAKKVLYGLVQY